MPTCCTWATASQTSPHGLGRSQALTSHRQSTCGPPLATSSGQVVQGSFCSACPLTLQSTTTCHGPPMRTRLQCWECCGLGCGSSLDVFCDDCDIHGQVV